MEVSNGVMVVLMFLTAVGLLLLANWCVQWAWLDTLYTDQGVLPCDMLREANGRMSPFFLSPLVWIDHWPWAIRAFFLFALSMAFKTHRRKVATGKEGLIGEIGRARTDIDPEGQVQVHGEIWSAYADEPIPSGERIRVVEVDGLQVKVEKVSR